MRPRGGGSGGAVGFPRAAPRGPPMPGGGRARVGAAAALRQDVARAAQRVAGLLEPELADVAGDRRLGDPAARRRQGVEQLELRADAAARDDAADEPLALLLAERPTVDDSLR